MTDDIEIYTVPAGKIAIVTPLIDGVEIIEIDKV